jgi:hypothetical protein
MSNAATATNVAKTSKEQFIGIAANYGVTAGYSGKDNTMYISGEESRVKSFIRVRNLLGKAAHDFAIKQSKV